MTGSAGQNGEKKAVFQLETRGLCCPVPLIKLRQALIAVAVGEIVELLCDDAGTQDDLENWCEITGHQLIRLEPGANNEWWAHIKKGVDKPKD